MDSLMDSLAIGFGIGGLFCIFSQLHRIGNILAAQHVQLEKLVDVLSSPPPPRSRVHDG